MTKYEKMVETNRRRNAAKEALAIRAIRAMAAEGRPVTARELVKKTGLSRSMFYYNKKMKAEFDATKRKQLGSCYAKAPENVINQALVLQVQLLKKEVKRLREGRS